MLQSGVASDNNISIETKSFLTSSKLDFDSNENTPCSHGNDVLLNDIQITDHDNSDFLSKLEVTTDMVS